MSRDFWVLSFRNYALVVCLDGETISKLICRPIELDVRDVCLSRATEAASLITSVNLNQRDTRDTVG